MHSSSVWRTGLKGEYYGVSLQGLQFSGAQQLTSSTGPGARASAADQESRYRTAARAPQTSKAPEYREALQHDRTLL